MCWTQNDLSPRLTRCSSLPPGPPPGQVTPEPPRLATRRPPSVHPPGTHRYRVPEPTGGWVVRPHIEAHGVEEEDGCGKGFGGQAWCGGGERVWEGFWGTGMERACRVRSDAAGHIKSITKGTRRMGDRVLGVHSLPPLPAPSASLPAGMDNSDGIEGLYLEKVSVAGRDPEGGDEREGGGKKSRRSAAAHLLGGVPYHHYISAQCSKEHKAVQVCGGGGRGGANPKAWGEGRRCL